MPPKKGHAHESDAASSSTTGSPFCALMFFLRHVFFYQFVREILLVMISPTWFDW